MGAALAALALSACANGAGMQRTMAAPSVSAPAFAAPDPAPATPEPPLQAKEAEAPQVAQSELPTSCAVKRNGRCMPPGQFVQNLCHGHYPDVALALFAKGTPWARAYVTRDLEAWDASRSRRGREAAPMSRDEEVIVLADRSGGSGMIVGGGSFDVLRWDGSCASLMADEVTFDKPIQVQSAEIPWRQLDAPIRDALLGDRKIATADTDHRRSCHGGRMGAKSAACRRAEERLTLLVAEQVRKGATLPPPAHFP